MTNNSDKVVEILAADLDASGAIYCPNPKAGMKLWNSHPKVYFDVVHHRQGKCPYCSTVYRLAEGEDTFGFGH